MAHAGVTTRSVEDTALMLDVLAEREGCREASTFQDDLRAERKPTIGIADNVKADAEVSRALNGAIEKVRSFGHSTCNVPAPLFEFERGLGIIESDRESVAERAFKNVDLLLFPTVPTTMPLIADAARNPQALSAENTLPTTTASPPQAFRADLMHTAFRSACRLSANLAMMARFFDWHINISRQQRTIASGVLLRNPLKVATRNYENSLPPFCTIREARLT
jgi:Asp-tRNA(Asn)/Glu-tRNA(Gln) amidotransferase A subunit family amidase